ncbi:YvcK family protein [Peptococcaceae bacterium 1198_IL3148]
MLTWLKWLYPGMGIKRWLTMGLLGTVIITVGFGFLVPGLVERISEIAPKGIPNWLAGATLLVVGFIIAGYGLWRAFSTVVGELSRDDDDSVVDLIYKRRYLQKGPKIVVIGGGTGLSTLLKGLKEYTSNITAIVAVTDDGGSSGRLRDELGILPPGDIRNCLVALADKESLMEHVLQYRFKGGEMAGHSLGNLFIAALSDLSGGFYGGVQALSKVLAIRGQVLPSTLENVVIGARFSDGAVVRGECSLAARGKKIKNIFLEPENCQPLPQALKALEEADAIVLGPGSVYTSVIPNLLVAGIPEAIKNSYALKVYVCNVMTQPGETKDFTASDHLKAIQQHGGQLVDHIIVNKGLIPKHLVKRYQQEEASPVVADISKLRSMGVKVVAEDLVLETDVVRHHSQKLARAILKLIFANKTPAERKKFIQDYSKE